LFSLSYSKITVPGLFQKGFPMNKIYLLLLLGIGSLVQPASGGIVVNVDTPSELSGTFSFSGQFDIDSYTPVGFMGLLPGVNQFLTGNRNFTSSSAGHSDQFRTGTAGTPDSPGIFWFPFLTGNTVTSSGTYNNDPLGKVVDFSTIGTESSGTTDGTFSGSFDFKVRSGVPDGGPSALLLGSAIACGIGLRKVFAKSRCT
jgi:hypothetical protein